MREKETDLQRLFSTFPGGWPGVGLVLLRAAIGVTAVKQGAEYLAERGIQTGEPWSVGLLMVAGGSALLAGFLTPLAGAIVAVSAIGIELAWLPPATPNLFSAPLPTILVAVVAVAVALMGPGALSLDCRLFGRREIIILHVPQPPDRIP